jgi:DNA-binding MarR family transcriptional regulator
VTAALSDFLSVIQRSRLMQQHGAPAMALVVHLTRTGPMRSSDLAGELNLDQSTVSRHVAQLATAGLVARTPDPIDGRAHLVEVTPAGRQRAHELVASRVRDLVAVVETWSDADRAELARLLTRFSEDVAARHGQGPRSQ